MKITLFFCKTVLILNLLFFLFGSVLQAQTQHTANNAEFKLLPVIGKEEFDAGLIPGDNAQYMIGLSYCESDPDRIYIGQDMGGVWVSLNAGKSWNNLQNRGLWSRYIIGLEVDPLNKNLVFAMAQGRKDQTHNKYQGLYRSVDGGLNWTMVIPRKALGSIRRNTRNIAYAPSSKDTKSGQANRWYVAFCEFSGDETICDDGFFYSDDAGGNWKEIRKLPTGTFGSLIGGIRVHPKNQETVYMYGTGGIFRFTEATNPTGNYEKLSGKNGLPEGDVNGNLYIDGSGNTIILTVVGKGIYKTTDGGTNWNSIYNWADITKSFVNEGFPDRIYATANRKSGEQLRVSKDGGKTWNTAVNSVPVVGNSGSWNTHILGEMDWVIPDPRNPDRAFAHGNAKHHQTDDGGDNWYPSNDFFNGSQHTGINHEQMFDPTNSDRFCYFMVDEHVKYTDTRGQWFYPRRFDKKSFGLLHSTCNGGAMHPDPTTKIILVSVGKRSGQLLRSANNGETWEKVCSGDQRRWFVGFDQQNPDYCYQWRERSADTGKTWEQLPMPEGTIIIGMSYTDGRVLYAMDVAGKASNIWRSKDRGDTWEKVIEVDYKFTSPTDNAYAFRVHPTDHNIVFTKSPDQQMSKWNLNLPKGKQRIDFDVFNGAPMEEGFYASCFAIDRRFPDVMYITNIRDNTGNKFFRSVDGGKTWENLSDGFPNTGHGGLEVSPVTGEVYISGGNGSRVLLPPYKTKNTAFELINYKNSFIKKPY